ncbi:MAG: peptidylprolyl isomerase [Microbacteriaceae bacterium]|nr:peptidylprolyl isomerase [Microbacteriaceae bacterium]
MRKITALIAGIALLGSLTACAGGSSVNGCTPVVSSGQASSVVSATGKLGTAPKVSFPTPLYSKTTQKSVLIAGHGQPIQNGQPVVVDATILNATSGAVLQQTTYTATGGSLLTAGPSSFPAVSEGLRCATVGSRLAIIGSPKDSHQGQADPTNGVKKNDSFIYVIDVKKAFLAKANGADQVPQNGMPAVVTTANGTPGITVPHTTPPKTAQVELLKQGSGAKLTNGHFAVVQYTGVSWTDNTVFDSTWSTHQAAVVQIGSQSLSAGLSKALLGKRVGSQVLAVLPAKDATVADGSGKAPAGATVIYVVDILGVAQ